MDMNQKFEMEMARDSIYLVIVNDKVVAECLSPATAGGIAKRHDSALIAEVVYVHEAPVKDRKRKVATA